MITPPLWLVAELTYTCPLHCAFCSNPVDFAAQGPELSTADWIRVLREARALGAAMKASARQKHAVLEAFLDQSAHALDDFRAGRQPRFHVRVDRVHDHEAHLVLSAEMCAV